MAGWKKFIIITIGKTGLLSLRWTRQSAERLTVLASHKGGATDGHEYSNVYDSISNFNRPINWENKRVIHPTVGDRGELLSSIKPYYCESQLNR